MRRAPAVMWKWMCLSRNSRSTLNARSYSTSQSRDVGHPPSAGSDGKLLCMAEQSKMTPQKAHIFLRIIYATVVVFILVLVSLLIYGLVHPARHIVLLLLFATFLCPILFTILFRKTGLRGLFDQDSAIDPKSAKAIICHHPAIIIMFPLVALAIVWGVLLATLGTKDDGDSKAWVKNHTVLTALWVLTPQVVVAYL